MTSDRPQPVARADIAALQRLLVDLGQTPGPVDGLWGPRTRAALLAAERAAARSQDDGDQHQPHERQAVARLLAENDHPKLLQPAYALLGQTYGPAGGIAATTGRVVTPVPFVIAWDTSQRITRFACHTRVANALNSVFNLAYAHYGEQEFLRLRLHYFGGCFNHRPVRGGSRLSTHSWGIAVDIDPIHNQLGWGPDRAAMARPEYDAFWQIVEAHGARSLGRAGVRDWMHFEFAGP